MKTFVTPTQPLLRITTATIVGARKRQEDAFQVSDLPNNDFILAAVADGLGGHLHGDIASTTAVRTVIEALTLGLRNEETPIPRVFREAFIEAHRAVGQIPYDPTEVYGPATTLLTAIIYRPGEVRVAGIGDSLVWLVKSSGAVEVVLSPQGRGSYVAFCLGYDVGGSRAAAMRVEGRLLKPGDFLILASDGLLTLTQQEVADLLMQSPDDPALALVNAVEARNEEKQDNCTVVVVSAGVQK